MCMCSTNRNPVTYITLDLIYSNAHPPPHVYWTVMRYPPTSMSVFALFSFRLSRHEYSPWG
jgi:hypothetical protein